MMDKAKAAKWAVVALGLLAITFMTGCSALSGKKSSTSQATPSSKAQPANAPVYYDFGDVLIPKELKVDRDESFVFNSPGMTAGVLALTGRVESTSLANFFQNKMPADGWQIISSIKSPRTKMLFRKDSRWCVISINDGQLSTHVEVWVAPSLTGSDAGLIK